ncbi:MAG: hypothetical protein HC945_01585 [Nitrosarchaeum sp.]|nr:hypothetical protein [Nitrosarchaeum sp.]
MDNEGWQLCSEILDAAMRFRARENRYGVQLARCGRNRYDARVEVVVYRSADDAHRARMRTRMYDPTAGCLDRAFEARIMVARHEEHVPYLATCGEPAEHDQVVKGLERLVGFRFKRIS